MKRLLAILAGWLLVVAAVVLRVLASGVYGARYIFGDMPPPTAVDVRGRAPDKPRLWVPQHIVAVVIVVAVVVVLRKVFIKVASLVADLDTRLTYSGTP